MNTVLENYDLGWNLKTQVNDPVPLDISSWGMKEKSRLMKE